MHFLLEVSTNFSLNSFLTLKWVFYALFRKRASYRKAYNIGPNKKECKRKTKQKN